MLFRSGLEVGGGGSCIRRRAQIRLRSRGSRVTWVAVGLSCHGSWAGGRRGSWWMCAPLPGRALAAGRRRTTREIPPVVIHGRGGERSASSATATGRCHGLARGRTYGRVGRNRWFRGGELVGRTGAPLRSCPSPAQVVAGRGRGPFLPLPPSPSSCVLGSGVARGGGGWPAVSEAVWVRIFSKSRPLVIIRVVWRQSGGSGGGRHVGRGLTARLGCGRAATVAWAAWLRVVGGAGLRRRGWSTGVHHLTSPGTGRRRRRPWTSFPSLQASSWCSHLLPVTPGENLIFWIRR